MNQNELFPTLLSKKAAGFFGEAGDFCCLSLSLTNLSGFVSDAG
jgi:hypothetical protein